MAPSSEELVRDSQDSFDYVSQCDLSSLDPSQLVMLRLPCPSANGFRFRCLAKESLVGFASATAKRLDMVEEGMETGRVLVPTYLPGVDLEARDFDFLIRVAEGPSSDDSPTVLHVERIVEAPPERVAHRQHETSLHVYELAEAAWERELWQLFDLAMMPTRAECPEGHTLVLDRDRDLENDGPEPVICDQCERTLVLMDCYTCGRCDFDLCRDCVESRQVSSERDSDPVGWLERELASFWEAHEDFVLPPAPPRQDMRDKQLSVAVTKWNDFALPGEQKLRLRETFLCSLQAHGSDVDGLRRAFWPGCAEEFAQAAGYINEARRTMTVSEWRRNSAICAGTAVTLGKGEPPLLLRRCVSGRLWELEDGQLVSLEAGSPRGSFSRGSGGASRLAWLAKGQDAMLLHASLLCLTLGAAWQEAWTADLLLAAAAHVEATAESKRRTAVRRAMVQQRDAAARWQAVAGAGHSAAPLQPRVQALADH